MSARANQKLGAPSSSSSSSAYSFMNISVASSMVCPLLHLSIKPSFMSSLTSFWYSPGPHVPILSRSFLKCINSNLLSDGMSQYVIGSFCTLGIRIFLRFVTSHQIGLVKPNENNGVTQTSERTMLFI